MALHVLFRDLEDFGDTLLGLFKAMLGDTDFFDEFSGGRYDPVATILVVMYLFVVTIMLLNLLIAILSASHAQVQENTSGAFKVSKARIITHYRTVVDKDVLPAPFNLVQLVLSLGVAVFMFPYSVFVEAKKECRAQDADDREFWGNVWKGARQRRRHARRAFGVFVLWLVLGSVAVAGGTILWALSGFWYAPYGWYISRPKMFFPLNEEVMSGSRISSGLQRLQGLHIVFRFLWGLVKVVLTWILVFLWCTLGAPCCLVIRWLVLPSVEVFAWYQKLGARPSPQDSDEGKKSLKRSRTPTIESMLKKGRGGVGAEKLREFLEDPMNDKDVRQDEKDRKTTVEHIKLLRDRLERTTDKQLQELRDDVASKREVQEMQGRLDMILALVQELKNSATPSSSST